MTKSPKGLVSEVLGWKEQFVLDRWRDGCDLCSGVHALPKSSFYRYRQRIIAATGYDITQPPPKESTDNAGYEQLSEEFLREHEEKGDGGLPVAKPSSPSLFVAGDSEIE